MQQTTSVDNIFRCIFFLGALRVECLANLHSKHAEGLMILVTLTSLTIQIVRIIWCAMLENLSLGFSTKLGSTQSVQLWKLATMTKFFVKQNWIVYFAVRENKGTNQTAQMHRLVCTFVFPMQQSQVF